MFKKLLSYLFPHLPVLGHVSAIRNRRWQFGESEQYIRVPVILDQGQRGYLLLTTREFAQSRLRAAKNPEDCPIPGNRFLVAAQLFPVIRRVSLVTHSV
jgi:hypothetical protein